MSAVRTPITYSDHAMIDTLLRYGHGWAKFAQNVRDQGWCSPRQREVLESMMDRAPAVAARVRASRPRYVHYRRPGSRGSYTDNLDHDEIVSHGYEGSPGQYDGEGFG